MQVISAWAEVRPWSPARQLYGWKLILLGDFTVTCVKSRNVPFYLKTPDQGLKLVDIPPLLPFLLSPVTKPASGWKNRNEPCSTFS